MSTLTAELEMYAGSDQPFKNFAAALNNPEVNTFTIALQQAQKRTRYKVFELWTHKLK